jgi:transcriptional regulator with XRE-family HTH domain
MTTTAKNISARLDLKAIGRRIREIRGFDLTQGDFGRMLGIGQTQLSKYELGQSVPTVQILLRLKAYSRKSIDWILTGEKPQAD